MLLFARVSIIQTATLCSSPIRCRFMATPSVPSFNPNLVKQESQHEPPSQLPSGLTRQQQQQLGEEKPKFLKSISDLGSLSAALSTFKSRFDDLQKHLDFIHNEIDSKFKNIERHQPQQPSAAVGPQMSARSETPDLSAAPPAAGAVAIAEIYADATASGLVSEIQQLCETMNSRGIRRYIAGRLSDVAKLREEVPPAMKRAPKPAKLVSDSIGRFYLQGIKAYEKDSPMIPARQAAVLTLEFFLTVLGSCGEGEVEMEKHLKDEAEQGAVAWRKRLLSEGGLDKASEADARGLLLYVLCFGIPSVFKSEDLGNLLRLCNLKEVLNTLKGSRLLLARMPDIINEMVKNGRCAEALEISCSFGMEDKFPPQTILTTFLQESKAAYMKSRQDAKGSPVALKQSSEKQLAALKSVEKIVEGPSWGLSKLSGEWRVKEDIAKLEKEIANLNQRAVERAMPKRKLDELGSSSKLRKLDEIGSASKYRFQEMQPPRFAARDTALLTSPHANGLHEQRATAIANGLRSYSKAIAPSHFNGHHNSYSSAIHAASGGNNYPAVHAAGGEVVVLPSYGALCGGEIVGDQIMARRGPRYGYHGLEDAIIDRSVGQTSIGHSTSTVPGGLYSSPGFAGLREYASSGATGRQALASDLYGFADEVAEGETNGRGTLRASGAPPSLVPSYPSTYMY